MPANSTMGLRCLALVTEAFGGRNGIAQYNRDLLAALAEVGPLSSLTVLPRYTADDFAPPKGLIQARPKRSRLSYSLAALALAFGRRVDVVFCGHLFMAPLAAALARWKSAKLVLQTHGIEAWERPTRAQRTAAEAADLILCVSRHTRARVLDWAAIPPERVVVLPNTVGEAFAPGPSSLKERWELEDKRVLLTVGRLDSRERYKGHDRVIATLPEVVSRGHDVSYVIVGEGDDAARLRRLAQDAGVAERVRFIGPVDRPTLIQAYRMADLFVMPSTGEGFGIAYLEAMAAGTPALGLSAAGAVDALCDGALGTAVRPEQLASAIADLLATRKPEPAALSGAVRARFGRQVFSECVRLEFGRLTEAA